MKKNQTANVKHPMPLIDIVQKMYRIICCHGLLTNPNINQEKKPWLKVQIIDVTFICTCTLRSDRPIVSY